jgi:hypothetical protein
MWNRTFQINLCVQREVYSKKEDKWYCQGHYNISRLSGAIHIITLQRGLSQSACVTAALMEQNANTVRNTYSSENCPADAARLSTVVWTYTVQRKRRTTSNEARSDWCTTDYTTGQELGTSNLTVKRQVHSTVQPVLRSKDKSWGRLNKKLLEQFTQWLPRAKEMIVHSTTSSWKNRMPDGSPGPGPS